MVYLVVFSIIILLIMLLIMYRTANLDRVLVQDLFFEDFPKDVENIRIFFISDIHRRVISDKLLQTVANKVDMVIVGGDLTERGVPISRVEQNLDRLTKIAPVYFVWGNNDYDIDTNELETILLKHKVTILTNTAVVINNTKIMLLGIDDIAVKKDRLDLALDNCGREPSFRILISHNPLVKNQLLEEHGIRLVLSGHTHGGQIRILGYGPYKLGSLEFFQKGLFLISNGYGTSIIPLRREAKPETHLLTIKRGYHTIIGEKKEIKL